MHGTPARSTSIAAVEVQLIPRAAFFNASSMVQAVSFKLAAPHLLSSASRDNYVSLDANAVCPHAAGVGV